MVQGHKTQRAHSVEHTGSKSFHDVLAIDTERHEGNGPRVTMLVYGGADGRRFDDYIVDNT